MSEFTVVQWCPICEQFGGGHSTECIAGELYRIRASLVYAQCPVCQETNGIGINDAGNYECRRCSRQFQAVDDQTLPGSVMLIIQKPLGEQNEKVWVTSLADNGAGEFSLDRRADELDEQVFRLASELTKAQEENDD